jgi:hypothetical protein
MWIPVFRRDDELILPLESIEAKKSGSGGGIRSRVLIPTDRIGRAGGLGDKPVRMNPTQRNMAPNWDSGMQKLRRFEDEF